MELLPQDKPCIAYHIIDILRESVAAGDGFLVERYARYYPGEVDADTRRKAAAAAEGKGKWRYAAELYEKAGDAEKAEALRARFAPAEQTGEGAEPSSGSSS